jgi:Ni,Fe-hydrogenase III large subunit
MKLNRLHVDKLRWLRLAEDFSAGRTTLFGMWGEEQLVHLCWLDRSGTAVTLATLATEDGRYSSIARRHAPALRFERMIHDLNGLKAEGCPDKRPWLRHDDDYRFLPVEGIGVHEIPVGPIHAGIIEPGHFRFSVNGETVVRLEERLGYTHKGVEKLMQGADLAGAAKLAARVSGDSTVAYSFAFARAAEAALAAEAPPRAQWLRGLMAELERLANHFSDIGFICNDAAVAVLHAHFALLREECLQLCEKCFGHRLMMDRIIPGGVTQDLSAPQLERIRTWLDGAEKRFDRLISIYDNSASLKDRTLHTGRLAPELAMRFGAGGFVGRASGRDFDARKHLAYAPYDQLDFTVTTVNAGDVNARLWVRQCEVRQSFHLIRRIMALLPRGEIFRALPADPAEQCEGMGVVEGFRGDVLVWLRLGEGGTVLRCHPRDPSWLQWPLLEAVIEGNIVADFPLCNKSFNCSYSGHDL